MNRPTKPEYPPEIEVSLPSFTLLERNAYAQMAEDARARGEEGTWADVRPAHLVSPFPSADSIDSTADVRVVQLHYVAYQRVLAAELDAPEPEVQEAAKREILRITKRRGRPFHQVKGGSA